MNKYTVITQNGEVGLIEVTQVEAKNEHKAFDVAVRKIAIEACGEDADDSEIDDIINNEELVCVLEGHCKCLINASFDNQ
jgi:hypothetical protein